MGNNNIVIRPWEGEAEALWKQGVAMGDIASRFRVTRGVIHGLAQRRKWGAHPHQPPRPKEDYVARPVRTMEDRLTALHARMDALIAETRTIPRIVPQV